MTKEQILAVTLEDKEGCLAIKKAVHEKLGLCWHEWSSNRITGWSVCTKCEKSRFSIESMREIDNPDYTHDIKAAWAIKKWLENKDLIVRYVVVLSDVLIKQTNNWATWPLPWASPLDRCKAFLLMDSDV